MSLSRTSVLLAVLASALLTIGSCGSAADGAAQTSTAPAPLVPAGIAPWGTVASAALPGSPKSGVATVTFEAGTKDPRVDWKGGSATLPGYSAAPGGAAGVLTLGSAAKSSRASAPIVPGRGRKLGSASEAVSPSGAMVRAWIEYRTGGQDTNEDHTLLRVAFGRKGRGFGPSITLRTAEVVEPYLFPVDASIDARGRAVVVTNSFVGNDAGIVAWLGTGRKAMRGPLLVARKAFAGGLAVSTTPAGRTVVAWEPPQAGEDLHPPTPLRATSLAPGASRFAPVQVVDLGTNLGYPGQYQVAADGRDTATLVWDSEGKAGQVVRAATTDASGRFSGKAQDLISQGTMVGLATAPDGTAVVTANAASVVDDQRGVGWAMLRAPGSARFTAQESLPLPAAAAVTAPTPAIDPGTGRALIAYVIGATRTEKARLVVVTRDRP